MKQVYTVADVNLSGKSVLVRVDFNVPLEGGKVTDSTRIIAALPTINYLLNQSAKVILLSHLGRPDGKKNLSFSLRPVAKELSRLIHRPVLFLDDCLGEDVKKTIDELEEGSVVMLENLRFYEEEKKNDVEFAKKLAAYGNAFVNDAFGTAHRAHASTAGIPAFLPIRVAGFLMQKELEFLGNRTANPERPFTVILGGAKVSDKIEVIRTLIDKCDRMIIGGSMAYTFLAAMGLEVGESKIERDRIPEAVEALQKGKKCGVKILLPVDHVITNKLNIEKRTIATKEVSVGAIPKGWYGVDIGPETIALFESSIAESATILWNGPMGIFEIQACAEGTFAIAKSIGASSAVSIVGGGDSIKALNESGCAGKISFISTGGGATLEFLEGKILPGVEALSPLNITQSLP
jgi:3-phosphoglycerate kinase